MHNILKTKKPPAPYTVRRQKNRVEASRPDFYKIFYKNAVFSASYNSGYAKGNNDGYNSGMQVRTGLLAIATGYGERPSVSDTLAPGTYQWSVHSKVEYWIAYKVTADGVTYAEAADYKGQAETHIAGTFTVDHKFNASVTAYAYGHVVNCVSINRF